MGEGDQTWGEAIAPLAQKLRVAAALPGTSASWNSTGARAFLKLLEEMAHKLDVVAPTRIDALREERDAALARLADTEAELATARDRIVKLERMRKTSPGPLSRLFRIPAANATGRGPGPSRDHGPDRAGS